jgi:hypothetical protein
VGRPCPKSFWVNVEDLYGEQIDDLRREFIEELCFRAIQCNASKRT